VCTDLRHDLLPRGEETDQLAFDFGQAFAQFDECHASPSVAGLCTLVA
jgi:hypothetical protein